MFNSIYGIVSGKFPQTLYIQTGSEESGFVEWNVIVPDTSLDFFAPVGEKSRVFTWLYHHDDSMKIFGFASNEERSVFIDLMKVEGVGPKAAIKILSNITGSELASVLDAGDLARLEKIPGIGKKTAQKMLLALKGKLAVSEETVKISKKAITPWDDVILALISMGYEKSSVEETISRLSVEIDSSLNKKEKEDILFRRAIVELAN